MSENKTPTLAELNRHMFAALLPETHARAAADAEETPKLTKAQQKAAAAKAAATPAQPQYTEAQLAALAGAGITDPSTAPAEQVAAILSLLQPE